MTTTFPTAEPIILAEQLTKTFTTRKRVGGLRRERVDFTAVDGIDLRVAAGELVGYIGPNGAGKSTTIKMLTGLLAPSSGSIEILGLDAIANAQEVKRQIGVVPEGLDRKSVV